MKKGILSDELAITRALLSMMRNAEDALNQQAPLQEKMELSYGRVKFLVERAQVTEGQAIYVCPDKAGRRVAFLLVCKKDDAGELSWRATEYTYATGSERRAVQAVLRWIIYSTVFYNTEQGASYIAMPNVQTGHLDRSKYTYMFRDE